ncbi:hypothetical protein MASR2M29_24280 [Spirochaetota bacterium]
MTKSPFRRATVVSVSKGRVVLREEDGSHTYIYNEPNPNITITVIDDDEAPCSPSKQTP